LIHVFTRLESQKTDKGYHQAVAPNTILVFFLTMEKKAE